VPIGAGTNLGIDLKFDTPRIFRVYDPSDPDNVKGDFFIIVL
jgi:hypothetical protein